MKALLKISCFLTLSFLPPEMLAQDSLSVTILRPLSYHFTLNDGKIQGDGVEFLKKEMAEAQFTLLGDYADSQNISELTTALIPLLHDTDYHTIALGVGVLSGRLLDSLAKEPSTIAAKFKKLNTQYSFRENEKLNTPMPDMKSVKDVEFVQRAGEKNWSLIGFGYESWNALLLWVDKMYDRLPRKLRIAQKELYLNCSDFLKRMNRNRNDEPLAFTDSINESVVVRRFLEIAGTSPENDIYISAFKTGLKRAEMQANRQFFEKNRLRIKDEKRFLKQELGRIGFDIRKDKLLVKWDRNFLSRGFQPYAFYGVGNTLSEIAEYNGSTSLHLAIIPRFVRQGNVIQDALRLENRSSHALASLLALGEKNQWTIINLQPLGPGHFYVPRKYLLNHVEEDFIKRFDILIIPPIEKEAKLLID